MIAGRLLRRLFTGTSVAGARFVRPRVVFMGDSITEFWSAADPWPFRPLAFNAGISGQTTAQMRARFPMDVITRRPRVVHIMGGTNDLWFGEPGMGASTSLANIAAMVEMAQAAGIAVILAPPPPIAERARPQFAHLGLLPDLRAGIAEIAWENGVKWVDYADALLREGDLDPRFTTDGIHLNRAGYRAMRRQVETVIRAALNFPLPHAGEGGRSDV